MKAEGVVWKNLNILLVLLALSVLVDQGEAAVDSEACFMPCVQAFIADSDASNSDEQLCNATQVFINCTTSCTFKDDVTLQFVLNTTISLVYKRNVFKCDTYATEPPSAPLGVLRLIAALQELFAVLFEKCAGFKICLTTSMAERWETGETHTCVLNRALKTCIYDTCRPIISTDSSSGNSSASSADSSEVTSDDFTSPLDTLTESRSNSTTAIFEEARDSLINVFFRKMEERGFVCNKDGLHSWTTQGPTTSTTTLPPLEETEYPVCSAGINSCARKFRPAIVNCKVQYHYYWCVVDECGLADSLLPDFLLRKLEKDNKRLYGEDCHLGPPANKAAEQSSLSLGLIATLLTLLFVIFIV